MKRNTVLSNILSAPGKKSYGRVVKPLGGSRYQVRDDQGRLVEVDSDIRWSPNAGVKMKDGLIVGKSAGKVVQKVYQV